MGLAELLGTYGQNYLDGLLVNERGVPYVVHNAICIHEEDDGVPDESKLPAGSVEEDYILDSKTVDEG